MAATAAVELKVLISVARDKSTFAGALSDLKSLRDALKGIDLTTLKNIQQQILEFSKGVADAAKAKLGNESLEISIPSKLDPPNTDAVKLTEKSLESEPVEVASQLALFDTDEIERQKKGLEDAKVLIPTQIDTPNTEAVDLAIEELSATPVEIDTQLNLFDTEEVERQKKALEANPVSVPVYFDTKNKQVITGAENIKAYLEKMGETARKMGSTVKKAGEDGSQGLDKLKKSAEETVPALIDVDAGVNRLVRGIKFLAGGFLGLEVVRFVKGLADEAARTQVLGTVLHVVAENAGITSEEIDKVDKNVQRLGITAAASRQSLTQFLQSGLDIKYAGQLARVAQDLAVIAGLNSSDTFTRLITNIQQMDVMGLRWMGIIIDRTQAEQKFAEQIDKTSSQLNRRQRVEAFNQAVLEKAKGLEGAYAAAMGDVGKQLTSLDRLTKEYKDALGEGLLPTYSVLVGEVSLLFQQLTVQARVMNANKTASQEMAESIQTIATWVRQTILAITEHSSQILMLIRWYAEWKAVALSISAITFVGTKMLALLDFLLKARLAVMALASGKVALTAAIAAMGASSVKGAGEILLLSAAQATAARTAVVATGGIAATTVAVEGATVAVGGLAAAWTAMAGLLAVPVIGYVIYKTIDDTQKESAKPFWQQVNDARKREDFIFLEGKYNQWLEANKEMVKKIKDAGTDPFEAFKKEADRQSTIQLDNGIFDQLQAQKAEVEALTAAYDKLAKTGKGAEIQIALQRKNTAIEEQKRLENLLTTQAANQSLESIEQRLLLQAETTRRAEVNATKNRYTEERDITLKAFKDQQAIQRQIEEELNRKIDSDTSLSPAAKKAEKDRVDLKKKIVADTRFGEDVSQAMQEMFGGKLTFDGKNVSSAAFSQLQGNYDLLLEAASRPVEGEKDPGAFASEMASKLREGLKQLAQAAQTPVNLQSLKETKAEFLKVTNTPEDRRVANDAIGIATLGVEEAQRAFRAPLVARAKENLLLAQEALRQGAEQELTLKRQLNDSLESEENAAFSRGLIALDEFYARKRRRIEEEGAIEVRLSELTIRQLEEQRSLAVTGPERKNLDNALADARRKLQDLKGVGAAPGTIKLQTERLDIQEAQERRTLLEQVRQLREQTDLYLGGQAQQIDAINEKYRIMAERLGVVAGGQDEIARARELEVFKLTIEVQNKRLEDQISLKTALLNLDEARLNSSIHNRELTEAEAIEQRNLIIQRRVQILEEQIAEKERQVVFIELLRAKALAEVRKVYDKLDVDAATKNREAEEAVEGLTKQIEDLNLVLLDMHGNVTQLKDEIVTYGQELAAAFTDSLGRAISDSLKGIENAKNAFQRVGEAIRDNVVDTFGRSVAEKLTRIITQTTSQKDDKGKVIPGTSAFDRIFEFLGLQKRQRGDAPGNRLYVDASGSRVEVSNSLAGAAGTPGSGINPLFPLGSGLKGVFDGRSPSVNHIFEIGSSLKTIFSTSQKPGSTVNEVFGNNLLNSVKGALFAGGGLISGPGTGTSDSIPARLSDGEYVMPAKQTKQFLTILESMRSGKLEQVIERHYAEGGLVTQLQAVASVAVPKYAAGGQAFGPVISSDTSSQFFRFLERMRSGQTTHRDTTGVFSKVNTSNQLHRFGYTRDVGNSDRSEQLGLFENTHTSHTSDKSDKSSKADKTGIFSRSRGHHFREGGLVSSMQSLVSRVIPHLYAQGGPVSGPGTGTSDSIPALVSNGEHIMPAKQTKQWLPVLEAMRLGTLDKVAQGAKFVMGGVVDAMQGLPAQMPTYAYGGLVTPAPDTLQSIALSPTIPLKYAAGGQVTSDGGSSQVSLNKVSGNLTLQLDPAAMNMTLREWLEQEAVRQMGRI